ncbi:hypothetical protein OEB99_16630 [Actinotalea sp. M2MS4P-6]|uniref:hypothetical protein n=1 Tax=Actinotalea sp. M2MS4P-6 TaxID=2983762 RepID=UPI0021E3873A|nr:hypothetical protein [Actinotalea sp. M2MS4P-6]MCV2395943.1 hypothetical protein [Actinotalea sp. M2MS4P-6]
MAWDWLFGPKVLFESDNTVAFNRFVLDVTDVQQIVDVVTERHGQASVMRPTGLPRDGDYAIPVTNLLEASDADLAAIRIQASPVGPGAVGEVNVTLWRTGAWLSCTAVLDAELKRRVMLLITENGRRRVQWLRIYNAVRVVLIAALIALPVWVAITSWPEIPMVVVTAIVSVLAGHDLVSRYAKWGRDHGITPSTGGVRIDAVTRTARRSQRWDQRRDLKVAVLTMLGTLVVTAIVAWANGVFA